MKSDKMSHQELSFLEMWLLLKKRIYIILLVPTIALIFTSILLLAQKPVFDASALIESGSMGRVINQEKGPAVEDTDHLILRILDPAFIDKILQKLTPQDKQLTEKLFRKSLVAKANTIPSMIEIKVKSYSKTDSRRAIELILKELISEQEKILYPVKKSLKNELSQVTQNIKETSVILKEIKNLESVPKSITVALINLIIIEKNRDLAKFENRKNLLELQLSTIYPARLYNNIYVPQEPVAPKKERVLLLTFIISMFVTILAVFIHNSLKND